MINETILKFLCNYFTTNFRKKIYHFHLNFSTPKSTLELFWIHRTLAQTKKDKNLNLVFRHRRVFKPQPEITWIVQILSKKLRHSLFYVFWLNIGLRAYWVTSILPEANFVRLLYLNTRYRVYPMIIQKTFENGPFTFHSGSDNELSLKQSIFGHILAESSLTRVIQIMKQIQVPIIRSANFWTCPIIGMAVLNKFSETVWPGIYI